MVEEFWVVWEDSEKNNFPLVVSDNGNRIIKECPHTGAHDFVAMSRWMSNNYPEIPFFEMKKRQS